MSLKDTLKKQLTPELYTQVVDLLGDDFDYDMVPRTRLNKVIAQRNEARQQLETGVFGQQQTDPSQTGGSSSGDDKVYTQADVDALIRSEKEAHDAALLANRKVFAATTALREHNAVDPDLILNSGLLKLDDLSFDKDGSTLVGLEDAITGLASDKAFLFAQEGSHQQGTGKGGAGGDPEGQSVLDSKLSEIFGRFGPSNEE